jgi:hypothetical protein
MSIRVRCDVERQRVVAHASGPLTITAIMAFVSEHRTGFPRSYGLLFDLRDVTMMPTNDDLRAFAILLASLSRGAARGRAALVASTDTVYGAARELQQLCEAAGVQTVRACRDLAEAEAWLTGEVQAT